MNTLHFEEILAKSWKYKPLPEEMSTKYRQFYRENIPSWLSENGSETPLYTSKGSLICSGYDRIVIGDYGAFIEFDDDKMSSQYPIPTFEIAPGQEYRINDERYSKNVKYIWLTIMDGSNIKIYLQKKGVLYADYIAGKYYVSVHEVYQNGN